MAAHSFFTPVAEDKLTRLSFPADDIEIVDGNLDVLGRGMKATIRVDGRAYNVKSAPCGLGCYCDAVAVDVTADEV
jgi:hypothetical protein